MSDVVRKVSDHMPKAFLWLNIFLSADMTIFSLDDSAAIQAIFLFSLGNM